MGKEWDGADGFRRSLNAADAGRDSVFGRTSKKAPEYRTAGTGRKGKPGIGARDTEWVSNAGWNQFRCGTCGHLFHGGSPCQCETPNPVRADNRWNLFQEWCEAWARGCLRVLKPGGYMLSFGGTKTQHRMVVAIEDAGFEIRDQIGWIYAQGFAKNDSSLKPAWEPVCVGRKPLMGTVAANMEAHGTGRLNIDECNARRKAHIEQDDVFSNNALLALMTDDELDAEIRQYLTSAFSDNTKRAYRADLAHFEAWGGTIPAPPAMIARYIADHARKLSNSTLSSRLVAIGHAHAAQGHTNPTDALLVRATLKGIRRTVGTAVKKAAALKYEDLLKMVRKLRGLRG